MSSPGIGQWIRVEIHGHQYYSAHSGRVVSYGQTVEYFDGKPMQVPCVTLDNGVGVKVVALKQPLREVHAYREDQRAAG